MNRGVLERVGKERDVSVVYVLTICKGNGKYTLTGGVPCNLRVELQTYSLPGQVSRGKFNLT